MLTTIRNNPKKSILLSVIVGYGCYYSDIKFKQYQYRRILCNEAKKGGDEHIGPTQELTRVTVIYNPVANNRKSNTNFNKNVFPLLNLCGYKVTVAETERPEEGKEMMSVIKPTDQECICIAGGDGTLMEVITGLLRREDLRNKMKDLPIVVVPLGFYNSFAKRNNFVKLNDDIGTCDDAIKLIKKGQTKPFNVINLRINRQENEEGVEITKPKDIFAISGLEWSVDRDVTKIAKSKWVFGPLRYHWQYFLSAVLGKHTKANKSGSLTYINDCSGCSNCTPVTLSLTDKPVSRFSITYFFFPMFYKKKISEHKAKVEEQEEKRKVVNPNCGVVYEKRLNDIRGLSVVLDKDQLRVKVRSMEPNMMEYMKSGVGSVSDIPYGDSGLQVQEEFTCSQLRVVPDEGTGEHYYVDNEQLDAVPLDLRVLKDAVFIYS